MLVAFGKGDVQPVIEEGVRRGVLAGIRPVKGKCNLVPLLQLAGDAYPIPGAGAGGKCRDNQDDGNRFRLGFRSLSLPNRKV